MSKKPISRKEEPPAEQPQEQEPVRPMAVQEPTTDERVEALEIRMAVIEKNCRASHGMR